LAKILRAGVCFELLPLPRTLRKLVEGFHDSQTRIPKSFDFIDRVFINLRYRRYRRLDESLNLARTTPSFQIFNNVSLFLTDFGIPQLGCFNILTRTSGAASRGGQGRWGRWGRRGRDRTIIRIPGEIYSRASRNECAHPCGFERFVVLSGAKT